MKAKVSNHALPSKKQTVLGLSVTFTDIKDTDERIKAYSFVQFIQSVFSELACINQKYVICSLYEKNRRSELHVDVNLGFPYSKQLVQQLLDVYFSDIKPDELEGKIE